MPSGAADARVEHYWGHETGPGRLVATQRMAQVIFRVCVMTSRHLGQDIEKTKSYIIDYQNYSLFYKIKVENIAT